MTLLDWLVVLAYLGASLALGLWVARRLFARAPRLMVAFMFTISSRINWGASYLDNELHTVVSFTMDAAGQVFEFLIPGGNGSGPAMLLTRPSGLTCWRSSIAGFVPEARGVRNAVPPGSRRWTACAPTSCDGWSGAQLSWV